MEPYRNDTCPKLRPERQAIANAQIANSSVSVV